ncbi:MAG: hypothetical protein AB7P76_09180 [Candidatus Melainabacteria bacterium]
MTCEKDWIDVLGAFGPFIVSIGTFVVAYRQWLESQKTRKHLQSERYERLLNDLEKAMQNFGSFYVINQENLNGFISVRNEAQKFAAEKIISLAQTILSKALTIKKLDTKLDAQKDIEKRIEITEEREKIAAQLIELDIVKPFRAYLYLD